MTGHCYVTFVQDLGAVNSDFDWIMAKSGCQYLLTKLVGDGLPLKSNEILGKQLFEITCIVESIELK